MNVTVELISPNGDPKRFEFADPSTITIGRDPGCTLPVDASAETVSATHARVVFDGQKVFIEDAGSTNGVVVEGKRISRCQIGSGQEIGLGSRGPRIKIFFVAPTVLELPPTLLESFARTQSELEAKRAVQTASPLQKPPTRVGSKTVMMMIDQAIDAARSQGRGLAGGTVFIREMVRQAVQDSSRNLRVALAAALALLLTLAGYVGYAQARSSREGKLASAIISQRFRETLLRVRKNAETQATELEKVRTSYKVAQWDLEARLRTAQAIKGYDAQKIAALRSELAMTRSRSEEIEAALKQTRAALTSVSHETEQRLSQLKVESHRELKQAVADGLRYIDEKQRAYLREQPAAQTGSAPSHASVQAVPVSGGMHFIPRAPSSLRAKKTMALTEIRVPPEVGRYGASPETVKASLRVLINEALSSTGRFRLVERDDFAGIAQERSMAEAGLTNAAEQAAAPLDSAQILLVVEITGVSHETSQTSRAGTGTILSGILSSFGGMAGNGTLNADMDRAAASVRDVNLQIKDQVTDVKTVVTLEMAATIRDAVTGSVKTVSAPGVSSATTRIRESVVSTAHTPPVASGSRVEAGSPLGSALAAGVTRLASKINEATSDSLWKGRIAAVLDEGHVVLNAGTESGVRAGDTFGVSHRVKPLSDPTTGNAVGYLSQPAGTIYVERVEEKTSICRVAQSGMPLTRGDDAEYIGRTVAMAPGETKEDAERRINGEGTPADFVWITGSDPKLYLTPSLDSPVADLKHLENQVLPLIAKFEDWLQVRASNGRELWLARINGREVEGRTLTAIRLEVQEDKTEALSSPAAGSKRLTRLRAGQILQPTAIVSGWYQVQAPNGGIGWVEASRLRPAPTEKTS